MKQGRDCWSHGVRPECAVVSSCVQASVDSHVLWDVWDTWLEVDQGLTMFNVVQVLSLIKYWKGDHIISVTQRVIEDHLRTLDKKKVMGIDVSRLHWTPYVPPNAVGKK